MKVLLAHNYYYVTGGADVFYLEVGRVLAQHGHEVAYFSPVDVNNLESRWQKYFPPAAEYKQGSLIARMAGFGKMVYSTHAKKCLRKLIADFKPDIVHVFAIYIRLTPSILDVCREAGIPVVMSCNDYKLICPNCKLFHHGHLCEKCKGGKYYHATVERCNKDSLLYSTACSLEAYFHNLLDIYHKNVHTFLFASEFMSRKTQELWGRNSFRSKILRNPFNSTSQDLHREYENYILFFGRLAEEKGLDILINAMRNCPDVHLKIVGEGPYEHLLKKLSCNLKLSNVEFIGPKWGDDLNCILNKARFVIVPSLWHENFPYVMLQAFAAGKAVIGSNRGGIPELLKQGEFGLIYPAENIESLSSCIDSLWRDPERTVAMGESAKKWTDCEFNDDKFYGNLLSIYRGVLE